MLFESFCFMGLLYLMDISTPIAFGIEPGAVAHTTVVLFGIIYGATLAVQHGAHPPCQPCGAAPRRQKAKKSQNLLASHFVGPGRAGRRLFYRRIFQKPAECAFAVFRRCAARHFGYVLPVHRRQHCSAEGPAAPRNFYYRPNNFIAVSGMMYRMKQNAAGLAAICTPWCW